MLLIGIVLVFATIRVITDTSLILAGQTPALDAFDANYMRYAGLVGGYDQGQTLAEHLSDFRRRHVRSGQGCSWYR